MKNPMMIVIIVAVVAVLGIGAFTLSQRSSQSDAMMKKDEAMMPTIEMMKKEDSTMEKTDDKMMGDKMMSSRYVEYSKTALDKASSTRRVLFFYASWCPTCRPADANFRENENKIPEDVTVIRVNYNDPDTDQEEKDLAKKYGITYQHTYVQIDGSGKEVTKWNGGQINELLTNIK
ncbi:hypothetical protein BH09PAT2_BH09PAT2_09280 [soil metagenome]